MSDDVAQLLDERTSLAESFLAAAIRLDVAHFLARQIEDRLKSRPHFLARTPRDACVQLRLGIEQRSEAIALAAIDAAHQLRLVVAAEPRTWTEEVQALTAVVGNDAEREASSLLSRYFFPDDRREDRAGDDRADLEATYAVRYQASATLLWAWSNLRNIDQARFDLEAKDGVRPTFAVKVFLPEALPVDPIPEKWGR